MKAASASQAVEPSRVTEELAHLSTSDNNQCELAALPAEILARILSKLAFDGPRNAIAAAKTCHALHSAAAWCWHETAQAMLGPEQPWSGAFPTLGNLMAASRLSTVEWREAPELEMPQPAFAHSSVVSRGTLYAFGGRHGNTYWSALHALPLPPQQPN
eukprot:1679491-Prymnesium_polylepis.1